MSRDISWPEEYAALIGRLPEIVDRSRLIVGGFSTCVDVYLSLREAIGPLSVAARDSLEGAALIAELERRATNGIGGELFVDWAEGPAWIDRHVAGRKAIGGTSAQAAYMLAMLGAPALVALQDRSAAQLDVIHPDVLIATAGGPMPCGSIIPEGQGKPPHVIFEFTAGDMIAGRPAPRSSRVIVRFDHSALERDPDFVRLSTSLAASAGAGILCGFNEMPPDRAAAELNYAAEVARGWRSAGLRIIHMELGDFPEPATRVFTIEHMMPAVTSIGMSLSELRGLTGADVRPEVAAVRLAECFGVDRVCIHADPWAFAVTRGDPEREIDALMTGCLLASARAAAGYFNVPTSLPDNARFEPPPLPFSLQRDGWSIACCPAPYLERPAATIGLGDTFLAGTLLMLGGRVNPARARHASIGLSQAGPP